MTAHSATEWIYIDGDSLQFLRIDADRCTLRHHEWHRPVELHRRISHPIFMNCDVFPITRVKEARELILSEVSDLSRTSPIYIALSVDRCLSVNPRRSGDLYSALPSHPYEYPLYAKLHCETRGERFRLLDVHGLVDILSNEGFTDIRVINARYPLLSLYQKLKRKEGICVLCDVGKLRSQFVYTDNHQALHCKSVPVGLNRGGIGAMREGLNLAMQNILRERLSDARVVFCGSATKNEEFLASLPDYNVLGTALIDAKHLPTTAGAAWQESGVLAGAPLVKPDELEKRALRPNHAVTTKSSPELGKLYVFEQADDRFPENHRR